MWLDLCSPDRALCNIPIQVQVEPRRGSKVLMMVCARLNPSAFPANPFDLLTLQYKGDQVQRMTHDSLMQSIVRDGADKAHRIGHQCLSPELMLSLTPGEWPR